MTRRWGAHELVDLVLDAGSFASGTSRSTPRGTTRPYRAELEAAAARAGTDESVLTGRGLVRGSSGGGRRQRVPFLGGSIGRAAAHAS